MRRLLGILVLLLSGAGRAAHAQAQAAPGRGWLVQGLVLDSARRPLREASVTLLQARDSSYVTFSLTDGSGRYALRPGRAGRYLVLVNALGYRPAQRPVDINTAQPAVELLPLRPVAEAQQLGEVVVTHEQAPVSMRGDTVAFRASAFKTQPNATAEQLLRKLPGLEVDRDGTIRAQGQRVNKVLVDGKPFFGGDPTLATRNLPASVLDQVQVIEEQNDQANFSGIDGGERQRTLNLVTRRDKRKGCFGTQEAGADATGRYRARLGLNRFNNGRQLSALAQADNVNQPGLANESSGPGSTDLGSSGVGSLSAGSGGFALAAPGGARNAGSSSPDGTPQGRTESVTGGLNYRDAWGKRLELAGSYLAASAATRTDQQARRQNVGPDPALALAITDRQAAGLTRTHRQRASLQFDYQIDSLTSLRLTPALNWQTTGQLRTTAQQTRRAGQLLNTSLGRYEADAEGLTGGGNALLRRKFGRVGRTFSANFALSLASQRGTALNQSTNTFYAGTGSMAQALDQQFRQRTLAPNGLLTLSYTEPLSLRHRLEAHYSYAAAPGSASRVTDDFDPATGAYDRPNAALSNEFASRYAAQRTGLTWQTRRLRYTYSLGLDAQQATLSLVNQSVETDLRRTYLALLPQATLSYSGAGGRSLRLSYRTTVVAPTATQLQPVPDNSNPLSIQLGNPDLRPEYAHGLVATYSRYNLASGRSVLGVLTGSQVQHRIGSATTSDPAGVRTTRPVNTDGYVLATGYLALGQRLPTHQLNLNASTTATFSRGQSFLDTQPNLAHTWTLGQALSANSAYNERLELGLRATLTYQRATYSLAPAQNTTYFTQALSADAYWRLPGRWVLAADAYFTNNTGLAAGYNQHGLLWNASLAYRLFAARQAEIKLTTFDLLNQNRSVVRTATDTYVEDLRSRVLQRYFLLSFTYNLRQFGK